MFNRLETCPCSDWSVQQEPVISNQSRFLPLHKFGHFEPLNSAVLVILYTKKVISYPHENASLRYIKHVYCSVLPGDYLNAFNYAFLS